MEGKDNGVKEIVRERERERVLGRSVQNHLLSRDGNFVPYSVNIQRNVRHNQGFVSYTVATEQW
jgi:hypothetical protein